MIWILIVLFLSLLILGLLAYAKFSPWPNFIVKGMESGFSLGEIQTLRRTARHIKLPDPSALFWSEKVLDTCIRDLVKNPPLNPEGLEDPDFQEFLGKILDFHKRADFTLGRQKMGLTTSRSIGVGQALKITIKGQGLHEVVVLENTKRCLHITRPSTRSMDIPVDLSNQKLQVYFWRKEDAGYYFDTRTMHSADQKDSGVVCIAHSDIMTRTQKRNSIRVGLQQPARIFPIFEAGPLYEEWTSNGGLACKIVDISETGAGVQVGGRGKVGMQIRLQTNLGPLPVVISGNVKSVNYHEKTHTSLLHLQALVPSREMRNRILLYTFGIVGNKKPTKLAIPEESPQEDNSNIASNAVE